MLTHEFPFDPTHGYDLEALLKIQPPATAAGFADFWQDTYARTRQVAPSLTLKLREDYPLREVKVYEAYFDSFDGFRCGGWLTVPRDGHFERGVVMGHGYGSCPGPSSGAIPGPPAIGLLTCGRGFGLSARPDLPDNTADHVVHHLDDRDRYIHRGCVADLWAAVSALLAHEPGLEDRIDLIGGSFGGGLGTLALAWEPRIRRAFLRVPSFGHYPIRTKLPCTGSGQHVTREVQAKPHLLDEVLAYYDSAVAATFIRQPALVAPALFDPSVHPPGQFAVYNAIPASSHKALHVMEAGHFTWPGLVEQERAMIARAADWFTHGR